jgi:hypothetical protein
MCQVKWASLVKKKWASVKWAWVHGVLASCVHVCRVLQDARSNTRGYITVGAAGVFFFLRERVCTCISLRARSVTVIPGQNCFRWCLAIQDKATFLAGFVPALDSVSNERALKGKEFTTIQDSRRTRRVAPISTAKPSLAYRGRRRCWSVYRWVCCVCVALDLVRIMLMLRVMRLCFALCLCLQLQSFVEQPDSPYALYAGCV